MKNLYYIIYNFENIYGEAYVVDTGIGILELGSIERKNIYEDMHLSLHQNIPDYLSNFTGYVVSYTKVL